MSVKRRVTRARKRYGQDTTQYSQLVNEYRILRKQLKAEIAKAKNKSFEDLCVQLNDYPFGDAYKIVTKKLRSAPLIQMSKETEEEVVQELFPVHKKNDWTKDVVLPNTIESFNEDELLSAVKKLKNNKAPGPGGIPPEIVKISVESNVEFFLNLFNVLLKQGTFPVAWKQSRLCLIEKPGDSSEKKKYRPIAWRKSTNTL